MADEKPATGTTDATKQTSGAPQDPAEPTGSPPPSGEQKPAGESKPADEQRPAGEQKPADTTEAKAGESKPAEIVYDLKLPDNSTLDPAIVERTAATARTLGLSPDVAQKVLELAHQEIGSHHEAIVKAHSPGGAEWQKLIDGWEAEVKADPRLGKTVEERLAAVQKGDAVLQRYIEKHPDDAPAFKEFLLESKLTAHPSMARFMAWLGKSAGEDDFVHAKAPSDKPKTAVESLWGSDGGRSAQAERDAKKRERDHAVR